MVGNFKVSIVGARGSCSANAIKDITYANNTSCILVQAGEKDIILDMGNGIVRLIPYFQNKLSNDADILLSHYHYDHIEGALFFYPFYNSGNFRIFGQKKYGKTVKEIFKAYLKKPFFPVGIDAIDGNVDFIDITEENKNFYLNDDVFVETMETNHPGGCLTYKITYCGKILIYMLDHEHGTSKDEELQEFVKNCDLLIYDAFYFESDFQEGWGHSTVEKGAEFAKKAGVKKIVYSHLNMNHSTSEFDRILHKSKNVFSEGYIAREGLSFDLINDKTYFNNNFFIESGTVIDYEKLISVGLSFSVERNLNKLLDMIISEAMRITNCDGGTFYFKINEKLHFKIMHNNSLGINKGQNGEEINLPPVPMTEKNVCSYSAIHKRIIVIDDVYKNDIFDFSGTKTYDDLNHYVTKSMIVFPLRNNRNDVIGVMQLINALDQDGNIQNFDARLRRVLESLAAQAGVALTNVMFVEEIDNLLHSVVELTTNAIDQRSSYNANHTRNVAIYTSLFIDYINSLPKDSFFRKRFTKTEKKELIMAAMLHDAGKISIPIDVMNKPTRLSEHFEKVMDRMKIIELSIKIDFYEGRTTEAEKEFNLEKVRYAVSVVKDVNYSIFLDDNMIEEVEEVSGYSYTDKYGDEILFFTDYEIECLKIIKGTFTKQEREIMEQHVLRTEQLLKNIPFTSEYKNVVRFAVEHHEHLDGTGYPYHLKGDEISLEGRILAVTDIFDALIAKDRPYKDVIPLNTAYKILNNMADDGKLDKEIVTLFCESNIYENLNKY